jgi:ABC-type Fe3+/spermidine/putrescine transport system ATPase subunit
MEPPGESQSALTSAAGVVLRGVRKSYGQGDVLPGLDLDIAPGEFFSLLGPSGCGKTTLLRLIAGLERPDHGTIAIAGAVVNAVPIDKRPTNMVFQRLALFPHLDVAGNIAFGLRLKRLAPKVIRQRVAEMLDLVALPGIETRAVASLSGGQQQRVAIARALVNEPAVLLLDEPLGALDLKLQLRLQQELRRIQKRLGTTFIYVTHNQVEALTMSDRIAVMNQGRIAQLGAPAALYLTPADPFVAGFMGRTNLLEARVREPGLAEAGGLLFDLPEAMTIASGQSLTLSIRPERLRLGEGRRTATLRLIDAVFMGVTVQFRLARPDGGELLVETLAGATPPPPGTMLTVGWDAEAAVPLGGAA